MPDSRTAVFEGGRWGSRSPRQWLPEVVHDIVANVDPVRIILFGSAARDEMGPNSDMDLLVVLDELKPGERPRLMGEIRFAIRAPMAIDVFVTDVDECERRKDVVGSLHYWPLREGEVVYERAA
ncbi:MAG: nucleotidyltransferase domain-containing protein [Actinomycetota bacterium]